MGDIMLGDLLETYRRGLRRAIDQGHIDPLASVAPVLARSQLNIANLECVLSDYSRHAPPFSEILIAPERDIELLTKNHINAVTVANNHALDHGLAAFERSFDLLREHGILVFGYAPGVWFQEEPVLVTRSDRRIGLLGYNVANFPVPDRERVIANIEAVVKNVRASVDTLIVSIHWGEEYTNIPPSYVLEYGLRIIGAGVDIVHGHHSHQVQGVVVVDGSVLAPSLGNFVFDQLVPGNRITALLTVDVTDSTLHHHYVSYYINDDYQPEPAPMHQDYLEDLSKRLEAHLAGIRKYRRFPGRTYSVIRDLESLQAAATTLE